MSFKEKSVWIMAAITALAYAYYVSIILRRAENLPITEVSYAGTLVWTIGAVIIATIAAHIAVAIVSPEDVDKQDQRDREIERHGEYIGNWLVVSAAMTALVMSIFEMPHFWIANVIYLGFVLATLVGAGAKIWAYRLGFRQW